MTVPGPARIIRLIGWLLLPVVAGAASFFAAWLTLVITGAWDWGTRSLYGLVVGGLLGAAAAGGAWYVLLRKFSRRYVTSQPEDE